MKKSIILILLTALTFSLSSQTYSFFDLNKENPGWTMVPGGNIICPPQKTSYGYAALCEGKMYAGFTSSGKLLWQRSLRDRTSPFFTTGCGDLIWCITKSKRLNLLNPEGMLLWTKDCGFEVKENPFTGRDGRVFVRGKSALASYSLNGTLRWKLDLKEQNLNLPLCQLNDGSLLVFFTELHEGKSTACRISPFGEIKENIVFSGQAVFCRSLSQGVIITFTDKSAGLCSVKNGQSVSSWVFKNNTDNGIPLIAITEENNDACLIYGSRAVFINPDDGSKRREISLTGDKSINLNSIKAAEVKKNSLFLCDNSNALSINEDGELSWKARLSSKTCPFIFYTETGYLVTCTTSWSILGYRMNMGVSGKNISAQNKKTICDYSSFYPECNPSNTLTGRLLSDSQIEEAETLFKKEKKNKDRIINEAFYLSALEAELRQITQDYSVRENSHHEASYFIQNLSYTQKIIELASYSGLNLFQKRFVHLLRKTNDPSLLLCLVTYSGNLAFDQDGELLDAFDFLLSKIKNNDSSLLKSVCDSTFTICRFMGKPLLLEKGKHIIARIMGGRYADETKEYARKTMEKILELKF
ncbi:PQQ-binding-like beta-propeller repeat protein [Treponema sp.]|uniref:outer membrane protein assembly factor BamB family protein n=1 Tax=Treponema sp. TaxID=166 RepID=UPI0025F312D6|nr:PQQ-binding-like beta-propeller repeat protein [Treponema sp.]MCR5217778.1 PQQ-binding-like beta-propeller repeat protein [Treponema sp.]